MGEIYLVYFIGKNEKTFRDRGWVCYEKTISIRVSGFKDCCPIDYGRTSTKPVPRGKKIILVAYLIISKHNNYININLNKGKGEWRNW